MKKAVFLAFLLCFLFTSNLWGESISQQALKKFQDRVEKDLQGKVPPSFIEKIFSSTELDFYPQIMVKSLTWKEAELPYYQFLTPERLKKAKEFLKSHYHLLSQIEKTFGVDKEVLVGIFMVETNFGKNTGNWPVLDVLYSMAISGEKEIFEPYAQKANIPLNDTSIKTKWQKRSRWAYRELLYFIQICYQNLWDPFSIKGSLFGAFGYPQFVPRSYLVYGYDWDKDGVVDLYNVEDALSSIANYLKKEGYKISAPEEEKKRVIMTYNHSEPYADTVLAIAKKLRRLQVKD